jgi:NitT/TauT family transport system ATP-binding protein
MSNRPKISSSITPEMITGIVNVIFDHGGRADIARIAINLQSDVDELLPVIDVAEALGLVKVENGDIALTELGREFVRARPDQKKLILRDALRNVEPFATIFKLVEGREEFTAEELFEEFSKISGLSEEYRDPEEIHRMLLEWLLYTELVEYNGEKKTFKVKKTS